MSAQYTRDQVKISVAKILQTLGWHSINSTPLEVLTDILSSYVEQIAKSTNEYANEFGQTEPNLDHLGLAFRDMNINLSELEEYVTYVNFGPPPNPVPKYPIHKETQLNFLKPGSKEVVTRPVHIHEHLPPMYPLLEGTDNDPEQVEIKKEELEDVTAENGQIFKKPADIISPTEFKRPRRDEEGSRPTREISSVMMTTSGFLSPAREGKLPEAKTPAQVLMEPITPVVIQQPMEPLETVNKKPTKILNKKIDKKKDKVGKELFKPLPDELKIPKKTPAIKDVVKMKQKVNNVIANFGQNDAVKVAPMPANKLTTAKVNKTLADARMKTEKLNTTITPIPMKTENQILVNPPMTIDKINTEPDKKKVNIFKKISNVKNEKHDLKNLRKEESRSACASPNLVIDERDDLKIPHLPSDVTIEPIIAPAAKSPEKVDYFDDGSPPGTPSTPKTPEISHSPPLKEKRKRKDSRKVKKVPKHQSPILPVMDNFGFMDMDRPKTPEINKDIHALRQNPLLPHIFPMALGGPGLIPNLQNIQNLPNIPNLSNPLFPYPLGMHNFGKTPVFPTIPSVPNQLIPPPVQPPIKEPSPKPRVETPVEPLPDIIDVVDTEIKVEKKTKEHKKDKKDKIKKKNKKDKVKDKAEKKKLKEEKKVKDKIKKEKKDKKKEKEAREAESPVPKLFLKIASPSARPDTPETTRKLNIKPIVKKDEKPPNERNRETSPGLAKISALVTGPPKPKSQPSPSLIHQPADESVEEECPTLSIPKIGPGQGQGRAKLHAAKSKTSSKPKKRRTSIKKDADGNEVWICPACNLQDDGSPMIGCDGCDAWYHWVCVKIQVPPDDNENWYCRNCLPKNNEGLQTDKKKKRKKREKKEH